jgi:hypothetical protein
VTAAPCVTEPASRLASDVAPEPDHGQRGDDQREDRQPRADNARDREHHPYDRDASGDAAGNDQPVRTLLACPARRVGAALLDIRHAQSVP